MLPLPYSVPVKFLHLSDLHLGKRLREYDLLEDASFMLQEALSLAKREALDAILVAGDVYDTGAPSGAAQKVLGTFLADCAEARIPVLLIAGNHDSSDRLSYLSEFARRGGVHIATEAKDVLSPVSIKGVDFHLLPYQSRASLSLALGEEFPSLGEGISSLFSLLPEKKGPRVLLAHQLVLPSSGKPLVPGGSETALPLVAGEDGYEVGGTGNLPLSLFDGFDYLALGHIHKRTKVCSHGYYPGAPLKFERDEAGQERDFLVVEIDEVGNVSVQGFPWKPLHDVVLLQGTLEEILSTEGHEGDYVFALLEDRERVEEPMRRLKARFPLAAWVGYRRMEGRALLSSPKAGERKEPLLLFEEFHKAMLGKEMGEEEKEYAKAVFHEATGEGDRE